MGYPFLVAEIQCRGTENSKSIEKLAAFVTTKYTQAENPSSKARKLRNIEMDNVLVMKFIEPAQSKWAA